MLANNIIKKKQESNRFLDITKYEGKKKSLTQLKSVECHNKELQTILSMKGVKVVQNIEVETMD
jgi:hypothetical protein